jgi:hypothetical protein
LIQEASPFEELFQIANFAILICRFRSIIRRGFYPSYADEASFGQDRQRPPGRLRKSEVRSQRSEVSKGNTKRVTSDL